MLAAAPLAYGQTANPPSPATAPTAGGSVAHSERMANHVMPGQFRATELDGATVYDRENANLGDIKDLIIDKEGKIAAVVLNVGSTLGMGGKFVAVSFNELKITSESPNSRPKVAIHMTKDQLKSAQAFDLDEKKAATGTSTPPKSNPPPAERK